ncbi:MAG: MFS transporter [Neisseriaceae bacterium]|nr:MAG: MFS transporter [Neisseriaceae bacterium]
MKLFYAIFSLLLGALFLFTGDSLFLNASNLFMEHSNVPRTIIGLVNAGYFFGAIISSVVGHRIISRVGHTRSFSFFAAVMALSILSHTLTTELYIWALLRFTLGFGYYSILMIIESWLNEKSDSSIRSRVLGLYETVFYIAFCIGALVLNFSDIFNQIYTFGGIFLILAILPLSLTKMPAPKVPSPKKISIPSVYGIAPLALTGSLIGGFLANGFISMSPSYASSLGFDVHKTSIFITCSILGGFLVQIPMGKFSDTYGRRLAIIVASSITCLAAIYSVLFIDNTTAQYLSAVFFGFGAFTIYPLSLARANDVLPEDSPNRLEVSRSTLFGYGLGALVSPLILGSSMQSFGSIGFEIPFIILSAFLAVFSFYQPKIPREKRTQYTHVGPTSTNSLISESSSKKIYDDCQ